LTALKIYCKSFTLEKINIKILFYPPHHSTFLDRGCAAAALRLWLLPDSDLPPLEMCGEKALNEHWQYITQGQSARISFTSADKAIGAQVRE
jgi:hypothetical protein